MSKQLNLFHVSKAKAAASLEKITLDNYPILYKYIKCREEVVCMWNEVNFLARRKNFYMSKIMYNTCSESINISEQIYIFYLPHQEQ